jgi:putative membrane protein
MNASLLTVSAVLVLSFSSLVLAQGKADPSKGNASKDAASAKDGKGAASSADTKFMHDMLEADLAELEAGKMASGKASDAKVKQFAQHMVDDHGAGLKE